MGTSSAVMSTYRLSRPRPAQADIRCSTVCTLAPPLEMVEASRVSVTASARHRDVDRDGQVDAAEHDAGVRLGRAQRQLDPLAAVQADAHGLGQGLEGSLLEHVTILLPYRKKKGWAALQSPPRRLPLENHSSISMHRHYQSACLRRNAGISKSSMPPLDSASTLAAAWVRLVRHTLGTAMPP